MKKKLKQLIEVSAPGGKSLKDLYFSGDGGKTERKDGEIQAGDKLYSKNDKGENLYVAMCKLTGHTILPRKGGGFKKGKKLVTEKQKEAFCSKCCTGKLGWNLERRKRCRKKQSCSEYDAFVHKILGPGGKES